MNDTAVDNRHLAVYKQNSNTQFGLFSWYGLQQGQEKALLTISDI